MAFVSITVPAQGTATKLSQLQQIKDNDDALNDSLSKATPGIANGSFESGSGADAPTGWVRVTWGTAAYDTTTPAHGAQAYSFTSTGAGGGTLTSEDFIECSEYNPAILSFLLKSSVADILNIVKAKFYDKAQSAVSDVTLYTDATTNPTSWTRYIRGCFPPATAKYMKIELTFADSSDATSGTCYMDGLELIGSSRFLTREEDDTISEQSTTNTGYSDLGSVTVPLPTLTANSVVVLRFMAEQKAASGGTASQRFRIGTTYSNELSTTGTAYERNLLTLTLQGGSGDQTMVQQIKTDNGAFAAYGKKDLGVIDIEILVG